MFERTPGLEPQLRRISSLNAAYAILAWDQETYMPEAAAEARAGHLGSLAQVLHETVNGSELGKMLHVARSEYTDPSEPEFSILSVVQRDVDRAVRIPGDHVAEAARHFSIAQHAWKTARQNADFSAFLPHLERIVDLKVKESDFLGGSPAHPYDNLLDEYEPGVTTAELTSIFQELATGVRRILASISETGVEIDDSVLYRQFETSKQLALAVKIIGGMGFDFTKGRVDLSTHPFCTSFDVSDVRLTTRVFQEDLRSCLFGLIHEAGHGLYEQGINPAFSGLPVASGTSMGIHESQSLFWENIIGRSREFWKHHYKMYQEVFPGELGSVSSEDFIRAVNIIQPSFIRIESDELTYNMHIILRFEIERDLIGGALKVSDVPDRWNDLMDSLLGIRPSSDALGCLQDVHWSFGGIGYFPSYSLGKLYAAMFWKKMQLDLPDVSSMIEEGQFIPIREWLRKNIHAPGRTMKPRELVQSVCGYQLSPADYLEYIESRVADVYGIRT